MYYRYHRRIDTDELIKKIIIVFSEKLIFVLDVNICTPEPYLRKC